MRVAVATVLRATQRISRAFKRVPVVMQSRERLLTVSAHAGQLHFVLYGARSLWMLRSLV